MPVGDMEVACVLERMVCPFWVLYVKLDLSPLVGAAEDEDVRMGGTGWSRFD